MRPLVPVLVLLGSVILAGVGTPVSPADGTADATREDLGSLGRLEVASGPRWSGELPEVDTGPDESGPTGGSPESPSATATQTRINPWGQRNVTVGVSGDSSALTDEELAAVRGAVGYWNEQHAVYTDREVTFEFAPDARRPVVVVDFVPSIEDCGGYGEPAITVACAPRYDPGADANVPTTVRVRNDQSGDALERSVKHEFGHLLGLKHGEEPMPLMRAQTSFQPAPSLENASERRFPWHDRELTVAIEQDGTYPQILLRNEVRKALSFYERGPSGWEGPRPRFEIIDDPDRADIHLTVTRGDECDVGGGYCWTIAGEDLDDDGAIEYYTRFEATFGGLEPQYLSWYSGRVIGYALGAENETALPGTFADPSEAGADWFEPETGTRNRPDGGTGYGGDEPTTEPNR